MNKLHREFADSEQLLINPTAIDELRFASPSRVEHSESRESAAEGQSTSESEMSSSVYSGSGSALLAARWTVPEPHHELMWIGELKDPEGVIQATVDSEHTELLVGNLSATDPMALSIARSLENRIHEEVAFRDHVIVENTSHLCVYRPFFHKRTNDGERALDWSGGVGPEVDHWKDKFGFGLRPSAKVAFVHTQHEIAARIRWLESEDNHPEFMFVADSMLRRLFMKWQVSPSESSGFFNGKIVELPPSSLAQNPKVVLVRDPELVIRWMEAATALALTYAFTRLKLGSADAPLEEDDDAIAIPPENVALLYMEEDSEGLARNLTATTRDLCEFFAEAPTKATEVEERRKKIVKRREEFWDIHDAKFKEIVRMEPVEFVSQQMDYPYGTLRSLADEKPAE